MKPPVVGRDPELASLARAIDDTLAGHGRMMLLRGEAGIGKSRLAEHTLELARSRGLTVLRGQAHPLHAGLAYAPVVEAIRPQLAGLSDFEGLAHLGRLMADPRLPASAPSDYPELARTQMFEAVAKLVARLAPAVLFIDDLHWADRGTIELVHYIGRDTAARQVLVLAAYRPGEASPALDDLAATVRRRDPGSELALAPLTDAAVAEITSDLLGTPVPPDFLHSVTQRAKGVPLFVTALVQGGFRDEEVLPTIVRDVVLGRLHQLGDAERRLIEIVAVAGEAGTDQVLRAVFDAPAALKNLIVDGLVTELVAARGLAYRVSHPLYAEVAYAEMTMGERRKLHAAVLAAIERINPDDVLTLAPHYREAGSLADPARAVSVMAEAGWRALAVRASDEAVRYLEAAVDLATPAGKAELLDGVGRAYMTLGDLDKATAAWTAGVRLADRHSLAKPLALLRFRLAMLDSERQDSALADDRLWAEVQDVELDSAEIAIQRMIYTLRHGSLADTRELSTELSAAIGSDQPIAKQAVAYFGRSVQHVIDQQFPPALADAEAAVELARRIEAESPFYAQYFRLYLSALYALNGDIAESIESARESVRAGALVELPSLRCFEHYALSFGVYLSGDLEAATTEIDVGVQVARTSGMPRALARTLALRAFLLAEQGNLHGAAAALAEARQTYQSTEQSLIEVVTLAATAITFYLDEPLAVTPFDASRTYSDPIATTMRMLYTGLASVNTNDSQPALEVVASLRDFVTPGRLMTAVVNRITGLVERDPALLTETAALLDSVGAPLLAAQTRLEAAELTQSTDQLPQILAVLERAGATHWTNRARQLARALGLHIRTVRRSGQLTNREAEVVRLLGDGLSNADIAARLFLSERTVETHLRNSYAKLDVSTRVGLARWANENLR